MPAHARFESNGIPINCPCHSQPPGTGAPQGHNPPRSGLTDESARPLRSPYSPGAARRPCSPARQPRTRNPDPDPTTPTTITIPPREGRGGLTSSPAVYHDSPQLDEHELAEEEAAAGYSHRASLNETERQICRRELRTAVLHRHLCPTVGYREPPTLEPGGLRNERYRIQAGGMVGEEAGAEELGASQR